MTNVDNAFWNAKHPAIGALTPTGTVFCKGRYLIWCYKTTKEDMDRIEKQQQAQILQMFGQELAKQAPGMMAKAAETERQAA